MNGTESSGRMNAYIVFMPGGPGDGGSGYGERLARIEGRLDFLAAKEDIAKPKVRVLTGLVSGMGLAAVGTIALTNLLS